MTVSLSPSTKSLMPQMPKLGPGAIWGAITSMFSSRDTLPEEGTTRTESPESNHLFLSIHTSDFSCDHSSPQRSNSSQVAGPSERSQLAAKHQPPDAQAESRFPPVIVRDYAYEPRPPIIERPIDERWVFRSKLPRDALPGLHEREARLWEHAHSFLYRLGGNRAAPPNTFPKTWGGLSKDEDEEMMRRVRARLSPANRNAVKLGLTPTEPNFGVNLLMVSNWQHADVQVTSRVEAAAREQEENDIARHGPLIKTPPNTPPPPDRSRVTRYPISPPTPFPDTPSTSRTSPRRSKRKRLEFDSERGDSKEAISSPSRASKRRGQIRDDEDGVVAEAGPSSPARYSLRQRHMEPTPSIRASSVKPSSKKHGAKGKKG